MPSVIVNCVLAAVVLVGAATDWRSGRIPNWLTLPAMAAGLVLNCFVGIGFLKALGGMLGALGLYFLFFVIGRGAGDAKLMGAVGAFVGWPQVATVMVVVALLGGVAALALAWQRGALIQVLRNSLALVADLVRLRWRDIREQSRAPGRLRMPHGPVIAAGTLVVLLFSPR
ncbi:MAG: prepilin peptidase [Acidobacteria bacterium]|nr:prepilin peptidase [Acidobacteriota bacterium]